MSVCGSEKRDETLTRPERAAELHDVLPAARVARYYTNIGIMKNITITLE